MDSGRGQTLLDIPLYIRDLNSQRPPPSLTICSSPRLIDSPTNEVGELSVARYIKEHTSVENQIEDDNTRISFFKDFDLLVKSDFCLSFIVELIIELYYILYEMNLFP